MTREQFKDLAIEVISNQSMKIGSCSYKLFYTDDIDDFNVAQTDGSGDIEAAMPLEEFLDDMYNAIMCREDER